MKRFFCTVCNKVKRVQKWPVMLRSKESINVMERVGECNHHRANASGTVVQYVSRKVGR